MNRARGGRWATVAVTVLVVSQIMVGVASAAPKPTSKTVLIGSSVGANGVNDPGPTSTGQANLTFTKVSAGNHTFVDAVVKNAGGQTLNNVQLSFGFDGNPVAESVRPVTTTLTPTFPVAFPSGTDQNVTIAAFTPNTPTCTAADANLGPINCTVGTLLTGTSFKLQVELATASAGAVKVKAVTKVAENSNDNGANQDTEAAEGTLNIGAFSCDSSSGYDAPKTNGTNTLGTCPLTDTRNGNGQSFGVTFPGRLTTVDLKEDGTANLCPDTACFGSTFVASIVGETKADIITWNISVDLVPLGKTNLNLNKLVIYHWDTDTSKPPTAIPYKNNQCTSTSQANCFVSATITNNILNVVVQTAGNGSTRLH